LPAFTILIPTRNRAHLLELALRSALNQEFDDYEIIVSDNSDTPETREVVEASDSHRIRYVKTPRSLSMPDSWEFAASHVRTKYVALLSDDDAVAPKFLRRVNETLTSTDGEFATWRRASYVHDEWVVESTRNTLIAAPETRETVLCESAPVLERLLRFDAQEGTPIVLNTCWPTELVHEGQRRGGFFFVGPAPDYGGGAMLLGMTNRYAHIDEALVLGGTSRHSIGASATFDRGDSVARFLSEFDSDPFADLPFGAVTVNNAIAATLENVLRRVDVPYGLDYPSYFTAVRSDLKRLQSNGVDVTEELGELKLVIEAQPATIRAAIPVEQTAPAWAQALRKVKRGLTRPQELPSDSSIRGEAEGFSNIFEAALALDRLTDPQPSVTAVPAVRT
jgi:glycosyltransferase involved in cell wall biosynthesis